MKFDEVIYEGQGIKLQREGKTAIIKVGGEKLILAMDELQSLLDALDHLERRVMAYAESEAVKKVVET